MGEIYIDYWVGNIPMLQGRKEFEKELKDVSEDVVFIVSLRSHGFDHVVGVFNDFGEAEKAGIKEGVRLPHLTVVIDAIIPNVEHRCTSWDDEQ